MQIEVVESGVAVQIEQQCISRKPSDSADRDSRESSCCSADQESRAAVLIEIVESRIAVQIEQQCRSKKPSGSAGRDSRE